MANALWLILPSNLPALSDTSNLPIILTTITELAKDTLGIDDSKNFNVLFQIYSRLRYAQSTKSPHKDTNSLFDSGF